MTPPGSPTAREVAKQLDRRRLKRRMTVWTLLLALIAAAAGYLRCGSGFGLGGGGGAGQGSEQETRAPRTAAGRQRCVLRVTASGITVDGTQMSRDGAVAACKAFGGAELVVTGDAREGDGKDLEAALKAAGVTDIVRRDPTVGSGSR